MVSFVGVRVWGEGDASLQRKGEKRANALDGRMGHTTPSLSLLSRPSSPLSQSLNGREAPVLVPRHSMHLSGSTHGDETVQVRKEWHCALILFAKRARLAVTHRRGGFELDGRAQGRAVQGHADPGLGRVLVESVCHGQEEGRVGGEVGEAVLFWCFLGRDGFFCALRKVAAVALARRAYRPERWEKEKTTLTTSYVAGLYWPSPA
jgi:hypothetical protein